MLTMIKSLFRIAASPHTWFLNWKCFKEFEGDLLLRLCFMWHETQETVRQSFRLVRSAFYLFLLQVFTDFWFCSGFSKAFRLNLAAAVKAAFIRLHSGSLSAYWLQSVCVFSFSAVFLILILILCLLRVHLAACSYSERQVSRSWLCQFITEIWNRTSEAEHTHCTASCPAVRSLKTQILPTACRSSANAGFLSICSLANI